MCSDEQDHEFGRCELIKPKTKEDPNYSIVRLHSEMSSSQKKRER
jgi:hypothetical protein